MGGGTNSSVVRLNIMGRNYDGKKEKKSPSYKVELFSDWKIRPLALLKNI